MSDGGLGNGLSYWATINIKGNLTKEQLKAVTAELRRILNAKVTRGDPPEVDEDSGVDIEGTVVQAARVANTETPEISVIMKPAKDH
jgi:hypothetical protein